MKKPKLAIVVTAYSGDPELEHMAILNCSKWKTMADDLIISEDGAYCQWLHRIADLYLLHPRIGTASNFNLGWKTALMRGADYIALVDWDVTWIKGNIRDMCIPNKVAVPKTFSLVLPMMVISKETSLSRGIFDDQGGMRLNEFDFEYAKIVKDLIIEVESCEIKHDKGRTLAPDPNLLWRDINGTRIYS